MFRKHFKDLDKKMANKWWCCTCFGPTSLKSLPFKRVKNWGILFETTLEENRVETEKDIERERGEGGKWRERERGNWERGSCKSVKGRRKKYIGERTNKRVRG